MEPGLILQDSPEDDIPRRLYEMGWTQGAVFQVPEIAPWSVQYQDGADEPLVVRPRLAASSGQWVVVSQACDIVAPLDKEPVIEACACEIVLDATTRASYRRSYRWFEID